MEIKKQVEKSVRIYKRLLHGPNALSKKSEGRVAGKSMYYNEEERDMVIARLLFRLIIFMGTISALVVAAIIVF